CSRSRRARAACACATTATSAIASPWNASNAMPPAGLAGRSAIMSTIGLRERKGMAIDDGLTGGNCYGRRRAGRGRLRQALMGCAVLAAFALSPAPADAAEAAGKGLSVPPETLAEFARAHQFVDIGGRKLNLF